MKSIFSGNNFVDPYIQIENITCHINSNFNIYLTNLATLSSTFGGVLQKCNKKYLSQQYVINKNNAVVKYNNGIPEEYKKLTQITVKIYEYLSSTLKSEPV